MQSLGGFAVSRKKRPLPSHQFLKAYLQLLSKFITLLVKFIYPQITQTYCFLCGASGNWRPAPPAWARPGAPNVFAISLHLARSKRLPPLPLKSITQTRLKTFSKSEIFLCFFCEFVWGGGNKFFLPLNDNLLFSL